MILMYQMWDKQDTFLLPDKRVRVKDLLNECDNRVRVECSKQDSWQVFVLVAYFF